MSLWKVKHGFSSFYQIFAVFDDFSKFHSIFEGQGALLYLLKGGHFQNPKPNFWKPLSISWNWLKSPAILIICIYDVKIFFLFNKEGLFDNS